MNAPNMTDERINVISAAEWTLQNSVLKIKLLEKVFFCEILGERREFDENSANGISVILREIAKDLSGVETAIARGFSSN